MHYGNIATVTKQRAFDKSMISKFTKVIFIDEATESTLDIDDWKTLTLGGYLAHDVKYQAAKSIINRCPMIITSQRKLDFGPSDQSAMDRRLSTYKFCSLPNPQKTAATWLRNHPMDCVLWATEKAKTCTRKDDGGEDPIETDEKQSLFEDRILQEKERRERTTPAINVQRKAKPCKTQRQSLRVSQILAANQATSWMSWKTS